MNDGAVQELSLLLARVEMGGSEETHSELLAFLQAENCNPSKSMICKVMKKHSGVSRCLSCPFHADSDKELRKHLRVKQHMKDKNELKGHLAEFKERIEARHGTPFNSREIFDYTQAEILTFVTICLAYSRLVRM